jgi:hypothetical protein
MTLDDPMWDDLFHGLAFSAFVLVAQAHGGPPPSDEVRKLTYGLYEGHLKEKSTAR